MCHLDFKLETQMTERASQVARRYIGHFVRWINVHCSVYKLSVSDQLSVRLRALGQHCAIDCRSTSETKLHLRQSLKNKLLDMIPLVRTLSRTLSLFLSFSPRLSWLGPDAARSGWHWTPSVQMLTELPPLPLPLPSLSKAVLFDSSFTSAPFRSYLMREAVFTILPRFNGPAMPLREIVNAQSTQWQAIESTPQITVATAKRGIKRSKP